MNKLNTMYQQIKPLLIFTLCFSLLVSVIHAEEGKQERVAFDAEIFRHIPVYHQGRVKPLDTFANLVVENITTHEKTSVKLNLVDYYTKKELASPEFAAALEILPEGKIRSFKPAELIMSWLAEPEKWERIPFIVAEHEEVRKALGLREKSLNGGHLRFVSPHEILTSVPLRQYILGMQGRREDAMVAEQKFEMNALDTRIWNETLFAYALFREVTFDPRKPILGSEPLALPGARDRFMHQVKNASDLLLTKNETKDQSLADLMSVFIGLSGEGENASPLRIEATQLLSSFDKIRSLTAAAWVSPQEFLNHDKPEPIEPDEPPTIEELEPFVRLFKEAAKSLAQTLETERDRLNEQSGNLSSSQFKTIKPMIQEMLIKTKDLAGIGEEMHLALYENSSLSIRFGDSSADRYGSMLAVVPVLNAQALAKSRDTSDISQPWLGLTSLLYGSDDLLQPYDSNLVRKIRGSWQSLVKSYRSGQSTTEAQQQFAASLRALGSKTSQARAGFIEQKLSLEEVDKDLLAYSAYPATDGVRIATEVTYNDRNPFMMCWIICLCSVICFSLSFGLIRKWMFWGGVTLMLLAIVYATYGFYMRVIITGWAPVTNMYETVVFVPWFICVLGTLFLLLPLVDRGRSEAWRATAFPFTWEASELTEQQQDTMSAGSWTMFNFVAGIMRIPLMCGLFYFLVLQNIYDGNQPIFTGMNPLELASADAPIQALTVFIVKLVSLGLSVWYLPRIAVSLLFSIMFCLRDWWFNSSISENMPAVYDRSYFGLAASVGGTLFFCVASYADANVLNENFSPLQPILRSNVWLTIHVLTIVASYGAGMLAWMLGVIGLWFYMFGTYRSPTVPSSLPEGMKPATSNITQNTARLSYRAPEQCFILGSYCYRAIQVAVLLLATGTILGGLWADVSWGRFWGWDPKEVWALISLLVYLAILHGRYAGMFHNFGLIVGTILGFSAIVFSWYGVNFMLPMLKGGGAVGLHSYGSGDGGTIWVVGFVLFNFLYLGAASLRFSLMNISTPDEIQEEDIRIPTEKLDTSGESAKPAT